MKTIVLTVLLWVVGSYAYDLQYHPFLLQTKDKYGETLAKTLDKVYGDKIVVKDKRCYFFEKTRISDIEYEIDKCRLDYSQQTIYSQADRLNGVEIKGTVWIEGNSYRTRRVGQEWSKWSSTELFPSLHWYQRTGFEFRLQDGEFEFSPTRGVQNIRGNYNYISKNRSKAIQNGDAAGLVIQESETGKIVIQESK
ncbi:MAG: hypothetical protein IKC23_07345 [Fibrobacter sp.]|jgi:hypothetical protein|uniref:hypothetical protein n=1 Tax=Fibrobacter sp. TaxID=35828 RepID=UPI003890DDE4|nr:hypothetical protein [Fibrobacter sp.]